MTHQRSGRFGRGGWSIALLLAGAAACSPLEPPPSPSLPQPSITRVENVHKVRFATNRAELTRTETDALFEFVQALPADHRIELRIVGHADQRAGAGYNLALSTRRVRAVAAALSEAGIVPATITAVPMGESMATAAADDPAGLARDREAEVVVAAWAIVLPGCPNWSGDPAFDPLNRPLSNLGCANAVNLGLMVADPRDLGPGTPLGPADGAREAEAIGRYRADKTKPLDPEMIQ
jgi:pilus assembly protein CpaD